MAISSVFKKIYARYTTNTNLPVIDTNAIIYEDLEEDRFGIYNTSNGQITIPSYAGGVYKIEAVAETASVSASIIAQRLLINVRNITQSKNHIGVGDTAETLTSRIYSASFSGEVRCNGGDILEIRFNESLPAVNLSGDNQRNWFTILRVGD